MKLNNCPYCCRPAAVSIGREMSDGSKLHTVKCSYMNCITIERCFSGYSPNYKAQLNSLYEDWNLVCTTLTTKIRR